MNDIADARTIAPSTRSALAGPIPHAPFNEEIPNFNALSARWEELRRKLASHRAGIWAHSTDAVNEVQQGWKLHLSATILTACQLLERCGETLQKSGYPFKMAATLTEIQKLNTGRYYGRSQVGKVITVYVTDPADARLLAEKLHRDIRSLACPEIPSDRRYKPNSNVFYRYGSYINRKLLTDGKMVPAYRDPDGRPVHDKRTRTAAVPEWTADPFRTTAAVSKTSLGKAPTPEQARYRAVSAIQWRGDGGIFRALDLDARPPRPCIMKEGLRHGNVSCDGVDGFRSVQIEANALTILRAKNVRVPRVHDLFYQGGNSYLVQDLIDGKTLAELVDSQQLSGRKKTDIARQICDIVSGIHSAGWTWRDIKLSNFLYDGRHVWAIDLEFAMPIRSRKLRSLRGTKGYFREAPDPMTGEQALMTDRYALGVTLQRLFGGASERSSRYGKRLPAVPKSSGANVARIIKALRDRRPERRPSAGQALECFVQPKP
jgi:hypothetical protein